MRKRLKKCYKCLVLVARELMRTKEDIYKELNLKEEINEDKLIVAMDRASKAY